jgi:hypothetical protein
MPHGVIEGNIYYKLVARTQDMIPAEITDIFLGNILYRIIPGDRKVLVERIRDRLPESRFKTGESKKEYLDYLNFYKTLIKENKLLKIIENDGKTNEVRKSDPELFG